MFMERVPVWFLLPAGSHGMIFEWFLECPLLAHGKEWRGRSLAIDESDGSDRKHDSWVIGFRSAKHSAPYFVTHAFRIAHPTANFTNAHKIATITEGYHPGSRLGPPIFEVYLGGINGTWTIMIKHRIS